MKKILMLGFMPILISLILANVAQANIKEKQDGLYQESVGDRGVTYKVDTLTQLCFASWFQGYSVIPCENLAKRPGWADILTWVKPSVEKEP